jgi:hypothetical protein
MVCFNDEFELEILIYQYVICENSGFEVEDEISVWSFNL